MHAKPLFTDTHDLHRHDRYMAALIVLQSKAWAYYAVLINTPVIWTDRVPTAGTDGAYVYINPAFFLHLPNDGQRAFLLAHEVGHIVLQHMRRASVYKARGFFRRSMGAADIRWSPALWNMAGDYVINADLIAHGMEFIPVALLDRRFSRDHLVDEVYLTLAAEDAAEEPEPDSGESDDADASDATDESAESEDGASAADAADENDSDESGAASEGSDEADDETTSEGGGTSGAEEAEPQPSPHAGHDGHFEPQYDAESPAEAAQQAAEDAAEIERTVDEVLDIAERMRERGELPGGVGFGFTRAGYRHGEAGEPTVEWQQYLSDWVTRLGRDGDTDWSRLNRRRLTLYGIASPSRKGTVDRIVFCVDLSGSISHKQLHQVIDNLAACIDLVQPQSGVTVIWFTESINRIDEVFTGQELLDLEVPRAGGAEQPSVALDYLAENGITYDALIFFTDGYLTINPASEWRRLAAADALVICSSPINAWNAAHIRSAGARAIVALDQ
jgi:predicted metal-dependent peptidase